MTIDWRISTKFAADNGFPLEPHLIVLALMWTTDADELKRIKRGGWTLEQVKAEAEQLFGRIEEARARSPRPPRPDETAANARLMELHRRILF